MTSGVQRALWPGDKYSPTDHTYNGQGFVTLIIIIIIIYFRREGTAYILSVVKSKENNP